MSGSGHFGHKITEEVHAALRKLFWQVDTHAVALAMEPDLTVYLTGMPCETVPVSATAPNFEVYDALAGLLKAPRTNVLPLLLEEAALGEAGPVNWNVSIAETPVFAQGAAPCHAVTFDSMSARENHWVVERLSAQAGEIKTGAKLTTKSHAHNVTTLSTRAHKHAADDTPVKTVPATRFYTLPVRKAPIPPHRFSPATREVLKKALAEKCKTSAANIQLKIVFERMDMSLYASMNQDEQGYLLCTPKPEAVGPKTGAARRSDAKTPTATASYLVFGVRIDTREDVRTLVPAAMLAAASAGEGKA